MHASVAQNHVSTQQQIVKVIFAQALSLDKLEAFFGFTSPTTASMDRLEFAALVPIIEFLERAPIPANADLTKPSLKKLDFNALSAERRTIVETGNRKSGLSLHQLRDKEKPLETRRKEAKSGVLGSLVGDSAELRI